jgi:hypothetical protein
MRLAFPQLSPPRKGDEIERLSYQGGEAILLSLTHPSARPPHDWGRNLHSPYLRNVVQPRVEEVRQRLFLAR